MAILDRFRQKWKHSDPAVRADAVRELDDVELLVKVAREDRDPAVRRMAVKKLTDAEALLRVAEGEVDEGIRRLAHDKAARLCIDSLVGAAELAPAEPALAKLSEAAHLSEVARSAAHEPIALAALARLADPREIGEVARRARHLDVRLRAVARIAEPSGLARIVAGSDDERVAGAALDRLDDPATLRDLATRVSRRSVRRQILEKLEGLGGLQAPPTKKRRAAQLEIVGLVETLATAFGREGAAAQIASAEARWQDLASDATVELKRRFDAAVETFRREHPTLAPPSAPGIDPPAPAPPSPPELPAGQEAMGAAPLAPPAPAPVAVPPGERELAAMTRLVEEAERLVPASALQRARRRLGEIEAEVRRLAGPAGIEPSLAARLDAAAAAVAREEEARRLAQAEKAARIEQLCTRLEALAASTTHGDVLQGVKDGHAGLKDLEHLPREVERTLKTRLNAAVRSLSARLEEMREAEVWERWSTQPAREELCKRIEELGSETDMRKVGRELADLRAEWDRIHPVEARHSDELDARFFKMARELRLRCNEHFGKLAADRKANLEKKIAICEKAEALSSSTDWEETAAALKALQEEWKTIGPVARAQADAVWQRFKAACDPYFTRRKEHFDSLDAERQKNLAAKEALCVEVEALAASDDIDGSLAAAKRAQDQWKQIGPVPRKDRDAIWKRFRQACDVVFDRRNRRVQIEEERIAGKRRELCERLAAMAAEPATETLAADVLAIQREWRNAGTVRADRAPELRAAFDEDLLRVLEAHGSSFHGTELDPEAVRKRREDLCARVEGLRPRMPPSLPRSATLDQMVEQLRTALNSNTPQDRNPEEQWRDLSRELEKLQATWDRLGPVPGAGGQALEARFRKACQEFYERRRG